MHKKIESELVSLAHSVLQMKNKDVLSLKEKAAAIHEKLSVLAFVDRYLETSLDESKKDILEKIEAVNDKVDDVLIVDEKIEESAKITENLSQVNEVTETVDEKEELIKIEETEEVSNNNEEKVVEIEKIVEPTLFENKVVEEAPLVEDLFSRKEEKAEAKNVKNTLEKELEGTISLDVTTDLFENAVRVETPKKTLNDTVNHTNLQIGLNDRIAFVKHLFDGSMADFNRVVSQLNSFKEEQEAINFVTKMVKSDYDWSGKEEYEERFITLITRKFA